MSETLREITVGALVLLGLVGLTAFVYGVGDRGAASDTGVRVSASFNRVDNLAEGDPVYLSGIRVGTVEKVFLNKNFRAVVTFRLQENVKIPKDSSAAIQTDGLFGPKFVSLEPGGEETPLADGDTITLTQDAVIVSDLLDLIIAEGRAKQSQQSRPPEPALPTN